MFDLAHGLNLFENLDTARVIQCLGFHLDRSGHRISRAEAEQRMFAKLAKPKLTDDVRPLLPAAEAEKLTSETTQTAFRLVFTELIAQLPGAPWARTTEMIERLNIGIS